MGRPDRARGTSHTVPASTRPLGCVPDGGHRRSPRGSPGPRRGDGSRLRPGPSGLASRPRRCRPRRSRRRRAGVLGGARAASRRCRRGGRIPGASDRADTGPRPPRIARAGGGERQAGRPVPPRRPTRCWRLRSRRRSTTCSALGWTCCEVGSRSRRDAGAPWRPRSSCRPRNASKSLDPALARETYLEALGAAIFAGRLGNGIGVREAAEAARAAPPALQAMRAADLLLDGLSSFHRRVRGRSERPQASPGCALPRGRTLRRRCPLALAGWPRRARTSGVLTRGRRHLAGSRDPRGPARPRHRCARCPSRRALRTRARVQRPRRGVRVCGSADRRG